jgi:hypothetical protein
VPFVLCPASLKESGKVAAQNQRRASFVARRKSGLDPSANGILVNAEQLGGFLYCVVEMDFGEAIVRMPFSAAFFHGRYPPLLALRVCLIAHTSRAASCGLLSASLPDREFLSWTFLECGQRGRHLCEQEFGLCVPPAIVQNCHGRH